MKTSSNKKKYTIQTKIENLFNEYISKHNEEPLYVCCCIKYLDNENLYYVTIKLNDELDIENDSIFYYCNSINNLKSLCELGINNFIIIDICEFSNKLILV